jgi:hypothetical protein
MEGSAGRLQVDQVDQVEEMLEPQEAEAATMGSVTEAKIRELTHWWRSLLVPRTSPEVRRRSSDASGICLYDRWRLHNT